MGCYRLPAEVEAFMLHVLDSGEERFGTAARDRYAALLLRAMQDVADEPHRPGTRSLPDIDPTAPFYPIRHSRDRVEVAGRVRRPRHVLVYEIAPDGVVDILGLIPDVMPAALAMARLIPGR